ncbi:MAG TPA: hypothetical protein VKY19_24380 [Ktedonosporobacter sp.]|jgi:O-antigen ligase|nr:hypothetical protein [Ktedonosporobacter sp.]
MFIAGLGTILFGLTIGWIAYRIMRLRATPAALTELYTLLAVISGALITALFRDAVLFGLYSLGLVIGFFGYLGLGVRLHGKQELTPWRTEQLAPPVPAPTPTPASTPAPSTDPLATTVSPEQTRTTPPKRNQIKEPKSTESL